MAEHHEEEEPQMTAATPLPLRKKLNLEATIATGDRIS
jgi:hypothetical protein